jgi:ribokinase
LNAGGKGANQAVAAARLNGSVVFVAKIGNDIFGAQAVEQFGKEGIDCRYIVTDPTTASGVALITVDNKAENCIVVAPGANGVLSFNEVLLAREEILKVEIVLVQLEIPLDTVKQLVPFAAANGKRVILNPAPACALPDDLLKQVSIITPNEKEAELLTGMPVTGVDSALEAAKALSAKGVGTVIITLGKKGALVWAEGKSTLIPSPKVVAVDTTAAGDVFNGALAVALAEGSTLIDAVSFSNHAAALSVTRLGAQASAPGREETERFIGQTR